MNIKVSLQAAVDFSDPPDCRVAKHTVDLNQKETPVTQTLRLKAAKTRGSSVPEP